MEEFGSFCETCTVYTTLLKDFFSLECLLLDYYSTTTNHTLQPLVTQQVSRVQYRGYPFVKSHHFIHHDWHPTSILCKMYIYEETKERKVILTEYLAPVSTKQENI